MRVDPYYVTNLVGSLDNVQSNLQQLTSELSSGVRVNQLSQDPIASGQDVLLLDKIQSDDSFTQSSSIVQGQLQVSDSTLGLVISQLTQAIQVATGANNGTLNASNEQSVANQLSGIRDEVLSLANTAYLGQYLFAGDQFSTTPFSLNNATTPATVNYSGDSGVNYLHTPNGQTIQLNVPGNQIFTSANANVFTALNNLIADYSASTVNVQQSTKDTEALNTALNYVSQQRVSIDNSLSQLTTATSAVSSDKTQMTAVQTNLMQADIASLSTQLSLSESQQTALESVIASLNSSSNDLFSKIH